MAGLVNTNIRSIRVVPRRRPPKPYLPAPPAGADPPNLAVSITSASTATLTWSAAVLAGVTDYSLFRRTPPTGAAFVPGVDTPVASAIAALTYGDTGLTPSNTYEWQVFGRVAGTFTPASLPSLAGWWDASNAGSITASGGAVSQWNDLSGNGYHVMQATGAAQPHTGTRTINGLNTLEFDGGDLLQSAAVAMTGAESITVFVVVLPDNFANFQGLFNHDAASAPRPFECYLVSGSGLPNFFEAGTSYTGTTAPLATNPHIVSYQYNSATGAAAQYLDGVSNGTGALSPGGGTGATTPYTIGDRDGDGIGLDGLIAEVIYCTASLGTTDRQAAEAYLKAKWGIPWNPTYLPGLVAWHDASNAASITASSGAVSQWSDLSGNGKHLTQATGSAQPTTGTRTQNGLNVIDFDGTTDFMDSAATVAQPDTIFIVARFDNTGSRFAIDSNVGANRQVFGYNVGTGTTFLGFYAGNSGDYAEGTATVGLWTVLFNGASSTIRKGGVGQTLTSTNAGSQSLGGLRLGMSSSGTAPFDGYICEIAVYSGALSATDRAMVEAYLMAKWGV